MDDSRIDRFDYGRRNLNMRTPTMAKGYVGFAVTLCCALLAEPGEGLAKPIDSVQPPPGVILVAATVEGQPATLLLDTGSERTCIDTGFAKRLRLTAGHLESIRQLYGTGTADSIRIGDLRLDSFHLKDMELLSSNLSAISSAVGVPIEGILGSDVLRRFQVRIDFSAGSAHFATNATMSPDERLVKLHQVGGLYYVPLDIQGTYLSLLLDTGTNASSVSSQAWSNVTKRWQPESMIDGIKSSGGSGSAKFVLIPTVDFGGTIVHDIPLRVQPQTGAGLFADNGFDGLLGTDVLSQFIVMLDLAHDKMYLKSDPNGHADLDRFSTIGIQFVKDPEGSFTIMAVWNPSPASRAGLKIGDRILAVNRLGTSQMSLEDLSNQIHGRPGTEVQLVIDSSGRRQDVSMAITCLLCSADSVLERRK